MKKIKTYAIYDEEIDENTDIDNFLIKLKCKIKVTNPEINSEEHIILVDTEEDMVKYTREGIAISRIDKSFFKDHKDEIVEYIDDNIHQGQLDLSNLTEKFDFYKHSYQLQTVLFIAGVFTLNEGKKIALIDLSYNNIPTLKFSFNILFPELNSIDFSGNGIANEKDLENYKQYKILSSKPPPPSYTSAPLKIVKKNEPSSNKTSSNRNYAIFSKNISANTDPVYFLSNVIQDEQVYRDLKPTFNSDWHLIIVNTNYNLVPFTNETTAITTFDMPFFNKSKDTIIKYVSNNFQNGTLDLSDLQNKFDTYEHISQLPTLLFMVGIYSFFSNLKITSLDLSQNGISKFKFSFKILFPFLETIDFTGNPILDQSLDPYYNQYAILSQRSSNSKSSIPLKITTTQSSNNNSNNQTTNKPRRQKMYAIYNEEISRETDINQFLFDTFQDKQICDGLEPQSDLFDDFNIILTNSADDLAKFNNKTTAITAFDFPFFKDNYKAIIQFAKNNYHTHNLDFSDLKNRFPNFQYLNRLPTMLLITGIYTYFNGTRVQSINLSNNNISYFKFSFSVVFPYLESIDFTGNPIENEKNPDECYSSYIKNKDKPKETAPSKGTAPPKETAPPKGTATSKTFETASNLPTATYAIYSKQINSNTNPKQYISNAIGDKRITDKLNPQIDHQWHLIIVESSYSLLKYNDTSRTICLFDKNFFTKNKATIANNIHLFAPENRLNLINLRKLFYDYENIKQLPTVLLLFGIYASNNEQIIKILDLSDNRINNFNFNFFPVFPLLEKLVLSNNPILVYENSPKIIEYASVEGTISLSNFNSYAFYDQNLSANTSFQQYFRILINNNVILSNMDSFYASENHFSIVTNKKTKIDLEIFNNESVTIVPFDLDTFSKIKFVLNDLFDGTNLDLSNIQDKFDEFDIEYLPLLLFSTGLLNMNENKNVQSINLTNNDIDKLNFPFEKFFPSLKMIDISQNPIAGDPLLVNYYNKYRIIRNEPTKLKRSIKNETIDIHNLFPKENDPHPSTSPKLNNVPIVNPIPNNVPIVNPIPNDVPIVEPIPNNVPIVDPIPNNVPIVDPIPNNVPIVDPIPNNVPIVNPIPNNIPIVEPIPNNVTFVNPIPNDIPIVEPIILNEEEEDNYNNEEEEEEEEEFDDSDDADKYLSYSYNKTPTYEQKSTDFSEKSFHFDKNKSSSYIDFSQKSKSLAEPNFRRPPFRVSLTDFEAIRLNIHDFPTHEFISSFFYDSWMQIETICDYYSSDSVFSLCVQIKNEQDLIDCPTLSYYKKYSRNLLLPNTNIALGSANIARAHSDYLFVNGFKAKPTSCSYYRIGNLFFYIFHGVFESDVNINIDDYTQKNVKDILMFNRSMTIQLRDGEYFISNDNMLIRMYTI